MAVTLIFQGRPDEQPLIPTGRETLVLDACTSQTHTRSGEVAEHPVETGTRIADHIHTDPQRLTINGIVSAYPISTEALSEALTGGRTKTAFDRVERAWRDRELLTVETSLALYENMAITSMTAPREVESGDDFVFVLELVEVRFAIAQTVQIPAGAIGKAASGASPEQARQQVQATRDQAVPSVNRGIGVTEPVPADGQLATILSRVPR